MIRIDPPHRPVVNYAMFEPGLHPQALTINECEYLIKQAPYLHKQELAKETRHDDGYMDLSRYALDRYLLGTENFGLRMGERLVAAASLANDQLWRFDLHGLREQAILHYQVGQRYSMHVDLVHNRPLAKLSVVALLSNPDDYEGGAFEIMANSDEFDTLPRRQGSIFVFPSFVPHRVTEVTAGERWALVGWIEGPRFR